jgi:predicted acylesterase/phospholipase RssA
LALSGGGFHASFFHIGVLARRDEFNLLRSIELISIVSSGSIIGVLHSLLLQRSFEFTSENKITPQAHIDAAKANHDHFRGDLRQNDRTSACEDRGKTWTMITNRLFTCRDRVVPPNRRVNESVEE